jgi:hypothetical protein
MRHVSPECSGSLTIRLFTDGEDVTLRRKGAAASRRTQACVVFAGAYVARYVLCLC